MIHKPDRKIKRYSTPDHRPMLPEFRAPGDLLDAVVREPRCRYDDVNPDRKTNYWR